MFQQEFALALVGVIGTGVGVVASLIPVELLGKRDLHERVAKMWRLLDREIAHLLTECQEAQPVITESLQNLPAFDPSRPITEAVDVLLMGVSHLSSQAWQTVKSNGDFVDKAPEYVFHELSLVYGAVGLTNAEMDRYSLYISTSRDNSFYTANVEGHYKSLEKCFSGLFPKLQPIQQKVREQGKIHSAKAKRLTWVILGLGLLAGIIFLGAIILFAILATRP